MKAENSLFVADTEWCLSNAEQSKTCMFWFNAVI